MKEVLNSSYLILKMLNLNNQISQREAIELDKKINTRFNSKDSMIKLPQFNILLINSNRSLATRNQQIKVQKRKVGDKKIIKLHFIQ